MLTDNMSRGGKLAYMVHQIWLFKNSLTFEVEIVPMHRVLERAYSIAEEYGCFDYVNTAGQLANVPSFYDSLATPTAV